MAMPIEERRRRNNEANRRWREANRERANEKVKAWYHANLEEARERGRKNARARYRRLHGLDGPGQDRVLFTPEQKVASRERKLANARLRWTVVRAELIAAYGGACVHCGYSDPRALQIDHCNGGGNQERIREGRHSMPLILRVIACVGNGEYQLLCANCNQIKRFENKEHGDGGWATRRKGVTI